MSEIIEGRHGEARYRVKAPEVGKRFGLRVVQPGEGPEGSRIYVLGGHRPFAVLQAEVPPSRSALEQLARTMAGVGVDGVIALPLLDSLAILEVVELEDLDPASNR